MNILRALLCLSVVGAWDGSLFSWLGDRLLAPTGRGHKVSQRVFRSEKETRTTSAHPHNATTATASTAPPWRDIGVKGEVVVLLENFPQNAWGLESDPLGQLLTKANCEGGVRAPRADETAATEGRCRIVINQADASVVTESDLENWDGLVLTSESEARHRENRASDAIVVYQSGTTANMLYGLREAHPKTPILSYVHHPPGEVQLGSNHIPPQDAFQPHVHSDPSHMWPVNGRVSYRLSSTVPNPPLQLSVVMAGRAPPTTASWESYTAELNHIGPAHSNLDVRQLPLAAINQSRDETIVAVIEGCHTWDHRQNLLRSFAHAFHERFGAAVSIVHDAQCASHEPEIHDHSINFAMEEFSNSAFLHEKSALWYRHFLNHKFALILESRVSEDHVSAQVHLALAAGAIPIYYGTHDVYKFVPHDSIILLQDQMHVAEVMDLLEAAKTNTNGAFDKLQQWRTNFKSGTDLRVVEEPWMCRVCRYADGYSYHMRAHRHKKAQWDVSKQAWHNDEVAVNHPKLDDKHVPGAPLGAPPSVPLQHEQPHVRRAAGDVASAKTQE